MLGRELSVSVSHMLVALTLSGMQRGVMICWGSEVIGSRNVDDALDRLIIQELLISLRSAAVLPSGKWPRNIK